MPTFKMDEYKSPFVILCFLFVLSVLVRLPTLNRPLSKHHEFCTALVLVTMDVWDAEGAATYHYSPVINYPNPGDLYINNGTLGFMQKNGTHYYLSHPPFAYLLPYFTFKLLGIQHSVLALQCFNLFFHCIGTLCLFLIVCKVLTAQTKSYLQERQYSLTANQAIYFFKNSSFLFSAQKNNISHPALLAAAIYLFSPATLWYFSNAYMSDMFVSNIWLGTTCFALQILLPNEALVNRKQESDFSPPKTHFRLYGAIFLLGVFLFFTLYTEWIGCFAAVAIGGYALLYWRRYRHYKWVVLVSILAVLAGFIAIGYHYARILGWATYFDYAQQRFFTRTMGHATANWTQFLQAFFSYTKMIALHYATSYLALVPLFSIGLLYYFKHKKIAFSQALKCGLFVSIVPVALHHFVFLNFTAVHDFAVVKTAVPLSILMAVFYKNFLENKGNSAYQYLSYLMIGLTLVACVFQYYWINRPGELSWRAHRYDVFEKTGEIIRQHSTGDELIFVEGVEINFQLMYYAKRNILLYKNERLMQQNLQNLNAVSGLLIRVQISPLGNQFSVERVRRQ